MIAELRYGTLNEVATPFSDMPKGDLEKMRRLGYGVKVGTLTQVDQETWNAIIVEAPEVAGIISGVNIWDHTIQESWGYWDFPVSIPLGHEVYAAACGRNKGTGNQIMTLTMQLSDPDGIIRSQSVYTTPAPIVPDDYFCDNTFDDRCVLDKAGTWVLYIKLEAALA